MQGKSYTPARKNLDEDFPLRGTVTCSDCGNVLTACWTKGRNKRYPYYYCFSKGCESYGKSIKRDTLEGEFADFLDDLRPAEVLVKHIQQMVRIWWDYRASQTKERAKALAQRSQVIARKIDSLMEKLVEADSSTIIRAYESKIKKLENRTGCDR